MPLAWRSGSNIHEYLEETASLIYTFPMLRFRVLGLMAGRAEIVLNEESGKNGMDQLFIWADYDAWKQDATQPQPHADKWYSSEKNA